MLNFFLLVFKSMELWPTSTLFNSPRNSWNRPRTRAIGSQLLLRHCRSGSSRKDSTNLFARTPRREAGDVGISGVGSPRAPLEFVIAGLLKSIATDSVRAACKESCSKKKISSHDFESTYTLFMSPPDSWNLIAHEQ
jgi:hypothetical protein